jgi:hypothetical protein
MKCAHRSAIPLPVSGNPHFIHPAKQKYGAGGLCLCLFLLLFGLFNAHPLRAETDYQNYLKAAYCVAVIDTSLKNAKTDPPLLMTLYDFSPEGQNTLKIKRKRYQAYLSNNQTEDKEKERNLANSRYTASENGKFDLMMCKTYIAGFCQVLIKTSERYEKCVFKRQECQRTLECFEMKAPF